MDNKENKEKVTFKLSWRKDTERKNKKAGTKKYQQS